MLQKLPSVSIAKIGITSDNLRPKSKAAMDTLAKDNVRRGQHFHAEAGAKTTLDYCLPGF
jgi:hypothetical protein